jgi:hypothetical protein
MEPNNSSSHQTERKTGEQQVRSRTKKKKDRIAGKWKQKWTEIRRQVVKQDMKARKQKGMRTRERRK